MGVRLGVGVGECCEGVARPTSGVPQVMLRAKANEIETEIRAQIMRAHKMGMKPTHIDTHMGTVYARPEFLRAFLKVAREFGLPAMAIEPARPSTLADQISRPSFESNTAIFPSPPPYRWPFAATNA